MRSRYIRAEREYNKLVFFSDVGKKLFVSKYSLELVQKEEIKKIFLENGFSDLKIYGDYDFSSYSPNSPRMIFVAKKHD